MIGYPSMTAVLLLAALIGATLIVVRSTIFRPIRRFWPDLLECSQCTGAWIGAVAGASGLVTAGHGRVLDALVVGAATSFLATLADAILLHLLGDPEKRGS
jgi:hypothetical protein